MKLLRQITRDAWKLLSFKKTNIDYGNHYYEYLGFGLLVTWICGIGRYWDNPRADLWQHFGLGSVLYVFVLAFILWSLIIPLRPEKWTYKSILLFVTFTSPPALFYAIPVEQIFPLSTAQNINVIFLAIVAIWRVALLINYFLKVSGLSGFAIFVASFLPITLIVTALTMLNLEHVVFSIMAGIQEHERSANDAAYSILFLITSLSVMLSPLLLLAYGWLVHKRNSVRKIG